MILIRKCHVLSACFFGEFCGNGGFAYHSHCEFFFELVDNWGYLFSFKEVNKVFVGYVGFSLMNSLGRRLAWVGAVVEVP